MSSLSTFPIPPPEGYVTLCEKNAEMIAMSRGDVEHDTDMEVSVNICDTAVGFTVDWFKLLDCAS